MSKYAGVNKRERDIDKALRKLEGSKRTQEKISKLKKAIIEFTKHRIEDGADTMQIMEGDKIIAEIRIIN